MMSSGNGDGGKKDPLARLAAMNPTVVVIATVALFLALLLLPTAIGALLILVIAAGLAALLTRTWPVLPTQQRVLRLVVIGALVLVALWRLA